MKNDIQRTTMIYGFHAVESIITNNTKNVKCVWLDKNRKDKRSQKIVELAQKHKIKHELMPRDFLDKETNKAKHQGVVAEYIGTSVFKEVNLEDILKQKSVFLLVLDGIQDPHNLGAILRSANAVGVDAVIATKDRAVGLTSTVRNISVGAAETTPFMQVTNLAQTLKELKKNNVWCIGAVGEADKEIYDVDFTERVAIVMGSEDKGLRRLTKENCDILTKIPMRGTVESLNVSVATGVILFEALRQRNG